MYLLLVIAFTSKGVVALPNDGHWTITVTYQECMEKGRRLIAETNLEIVKEYGAEYEVKMMPFCLKAPQQLGGVWR